MASSRQEKLQMRQRGAATRKIKEVDFGFSFGLDPPGSAFGDPSHASQPTGIIPEPPPPSNSAPASGLSVSPSRKSLQGPGSARGGPQRRSIFDIPLDEPAEERRGSKRRKLESPKKSLEARGGQDDAITQLEPVSSHHEQNQPSEQQLEVNGGNEDSLLGQEPSQLDDSASKRPNGKPKRRSMSDDTPSETARPAATNGKRRSSGSGSDDRPPSRNENEYSATTQNAGNIRKPSPPVSPQEKSLQEDGKARVSEGKKEKRPRGRPSKTARKSSDENPGAGGPHLTSPNDASAELQNRPSPTNASPVNAVAVDTAQEVPASETRISGVQRGKRPRGRPSTSARTARDKDKEPEKRHETSAEAGSAEIRRKGRPRKKSNDDGLPTKASTTKANGELNNEVNGRHAQPKDTSSSRNIPQPQKQKGATKKRGGGRSRQSLNGPQPQSAQEPEPEQPDSESHEPEPVPRELSPVQERGRRRGRPSKSGSRAAQPENEQSPQQADEESARPTRKGRNRGETVPVTVHRLANAASLTGVPDDSDSSGEEESSDELSTKHRTKLPSRGGVNPADVLSQVCRETLEKTLTTLKTGISNETNPSRRSEHVRKTKAVEAYGAELEGRLFELSEIHDSNFVLGVQAKKAKREMMDLRSKLYHIRKERQEVALQTDAVRRKYTEENSARMIRSTINNTLHSLELAVDRPQSSERPEGVTAGLEFKLRTLAQRVSSMAPGAHGGLLNQIQAFNAQLEAAAEKLE